MNNGLLAEAMAAPIGGEEYWQERCLKAEAEREALQQRVRRLRRRLTCREYDVTLAQNKHEEGKR